MELRWDAPKTVCGLEAMLLEASALLRGTFPSPSSATRLVGLLLDAAGVGRFVKKPAMLCCLELDLAVLEGAAFCVDGVDLMLASLARAILTVSYTYRVYEQGTER